MIKNKHPSYIPPNTYSLRLMGDDEMKAKCEIIYSSSCLLSKHSTLDSTMFGANLSEPECSICSNRIDTCPGHSGCIISPFPFVKAVCIKNFKLLTTAICPICSSFPVNGSVVRKCNRTDKRYKLKYVISEVKKTLERSRDKPIVCPRCENKITLMEIISDAPLLTIGFKQPDSTVYEQVNPLAIHNMLRNFTDMNMTGWDDSYHPANFMTCIIPIIPNKLRFKAIDNSVSVLTSYYRVILEEIIPELDKIYKTLTAEDSIVLSKGNIKNNFNEYYSRLISYYMLMTDPTQDSTRDICLAKIDKRDKKHFEPGISAIGRLKGKDDSYFMKGIISVRVDDACRTVLGGACDSELINVNVPCHIASKLTISYPVFVQNIKAMQQILASMSNISVYTDITIPHVVFVLKCGSGVRQKVHPKEAQTMAAALRPGDKLELSLQDGDMVMQCRFPSIREESWTSLQVKRDNNSIISIPLSICKMKVADFDGDEAQIYCPSSICYQLEQLLLHSCYRMLVAPKDGRFAIWYSADASFGIDKIQKDKRLIINDFDSTEPYLITDRIEKMFPKDLNYEDNKTVIKNGKFVNGKTNMDNENFMKYVLGLYGPHCVQKIMDTTVQATYDLNRNDGDTIGFEICIVDPKVKAELKKIKDGLYEKLKKDELTNVQHKDVVQLLHCQEIKGKTQKMLCEDSKNTTLTVFGFLPKYVVEYSHICYMLDHQLDDDGGRFRNKVASGSRTICSYPRYSIDPKAYGFVYTGYADDVDPISNFWNCKSMRRNLYLRSGEAIRKQGYMQKRLGVMYGSAYADFNSGVVTSKRLISLCYGAPGFDPRKYHACPVIDIKLPVKEFEKKYGDDKRLLSLRREIIEWNSIWSSQTTSFDVPESYESFITGFDWEQYIKNHCPKGKTDIATVNKFIKDMNDIYEPPGMCKEGIWNNHLKLQNIKHHEYYFRILLGHMYKVSDEMLSKVLSIFEQLLVNGGETVGMKAANSTAEPMSQAVLKAIHSAGATVNDNILQREGGVAAFEVLLGGQKPKDTVITIGLYDDCEETTKKWAEAQETFYFNDIWTRAEINITGSVDKTIIEMYPNIDFSQFSFNHVSISMIWNVVNIAGYNIHVVDIINKLCEKYSQIMVIVGYVLNSSEFKAIIYFKENVLFDQINVLLDEWSIEKTSTIVHGGYLKNCFVTENKSDPGHYIIQANELDANNNSLENIIFDPEIDPYKCSSTNIKSCHKLFGCCEANARHISESVYVAKHLSATSGLLSLHYKLISDMSFSTGTLLTASRHSLHDDEDRDILQSINFETAKDFISDGVSSNMKHRDDSLVSSTFFGGCGSQHSGDMVSSVSLYET